MNPVDGFNKAIKTRSNFRFGSTEIISREEVTEIFLFGRKIATIEWRSGRLRISHAGIKTPTTQKRLNMILRHFTNSKITVKAKKWFLNGEEFNFADLPISHKVSA